MPVRSPSESIGALSRALGLPPWCREATIRLTVGNAVTVNTQCYATDEQLKALADEIVNRRMVLVDADEYARLKQLDDGGTRGQLMEAMRRGTASANEARAAAGLPPIDPPEAPA